MSCNGTGTIRLRCLLYLPPDTVFKPLPSLLSAVGLEAPVYPVLHHGNELLVAQQSIAVIVKYLEDGVDHVATEVLPCADVDRTGELLLWNYLVIIDQF